MPANFLNLYPKLTSPANGAINPQGFWLAHGDEPLLQQWLTDALRTHWQEHHLAIKRIELVSAKTWADVMGELNSLSLFDDTTAVIVTGNHKPDKAMQDTLMQVAQEGTNNALLWLMPKLDKRSLSAKWIAPFSKFGQVVDCQLYDERQRRQVLTMKANEFGITLSDEAWQMLMMQTEHHLLGAYQTLWRLADLYRLDNNANELTPIDIDKLQSGLVSESQFTAFDLSDAMLAGNAEQVVKIIDHLKTADEPPARVLWVLAKDMRLIQRLLDGQSPQSLGIWRSKEILYLNASRRQSSVSVADWSSMLYECDKAVKGVIRQPAWELILQMALGVAGVQLFESVA